MKLREKTLIVLEGLFVGQEIELPMINHQKDKIALLKDKQLYFVNDDQYQIKNGERTPIAIGLDSFSINDFIKTCDKLTDDEVAIIAANTALIKTNNKNRKQS